MPFATYTINTKLLNEFNKVNVRALEKFNNDIEELNIKQKAIFIKNASTDIEKNIQKKIDDISKSNLDINLHEKKYLLEKLQGALDKSISCKLSNKEINEVPIDFEKKHNNEIPRELKLKILAGDFYPEDFDGNIDKFISKFLNKINIYLFSKYKNKKEQIKNIFIYQKELGKYLMPNKDSIFCESIQEFKNKLNPKDKNQKNNLESIRKIEYGVYVLFKWWSKIPDYIKPKFRILTDIPESVKKYQRESKKTIPDEGLKILEEKIEEFLFLDASKFKTKPEVRLIWQSKMPGVKGWSHKRHWIFGPNISLDPEIIKKINNNEKSLKDLRNKEINFLAIKSDYGVEIVDPNNNSKLSNLMELKVINNQNIKQMSDIREYLIHDAVKDHI
jgi:hypothetical protein|tara:strand:+ start:833 stop:1999 length:1167 start_codon:yes stop_codon:yes gene_type:complete